MAELQRVNLAAVRERYADNYNNGLKYFQKGALSNAWRTASARPLS